MNALTAWICRAPDSAPALLDLPGEFTGQAGRAVELTYGGLRRALSAAAADIPTPPSGRADAPGTRAPAPLAIAAGSRIELVMNVLLADWLGRPALPLPLDPVARAGFGLPAGPGIVIGTARESVAANPGWASHAVNWRQALGGGIACGPVRGGASAWIVATSGTSGRPRLAVLSGNAIAASVAASVEALGLSRGDRWLLALAPDRIAGLMVVARTLACAGALRVDETWNAEAFASTVAAARINRISVVPAMLAPLLEDALPAGELATVLVGGAALTEPMADRLRADGWPAWVSYGMTETCSHITLAPVDTHWRPGLAGRTVGNARVSAGAGPNQPEPIRVSGDMLMDGYLGEAPLAGDFQTGDLGFTDAVGRLHITGRGDDVIVTGGVNVHPARVEAVLRSLRGVSDAAVGSLPDPRWGQRLVAVIVGPVSDAALEAHCQARLPSAERPRDFLRAHSLPVAETGKLDRRAVSGMVRAHLQASSDREA